MKTIIAGSRSAYSLRLVRQAMQAACEAGVQPSAIVSGAARGADRFRERWAREMNLPVLRFLADWNRHGRSAGYIRDAEMAQYADALVAVWDGESRGTRHMIDLARKHGLTVYVHTFCPFGLD